MTDKLGQDQLGVRERPILFSGPMVRAILDDRKTQTRRIIKPEPDFHKGYYSARGVSWKSQIGARQVPSSPYGRPGDRLWVRETWRCDCPDDPEYALYRADGYDDVMLPPGFKWRPSIFMPRWASRIVLEITSVRVERLCKISPDDVIAEGVEKRARSAVFPWQAYTKEDYAKLWDSINGPGSFDKNPWVWAISFKRVSP